MIGDLTIGQALVADIVVWTVLGVTVGWTNHRRSLARLSEDGWLPALRSWESSRGIYQRWFRIRSWKSRLPEAGALFTGGVSKRGLPSRRRDGLERFVLETRRAERVHWALLAAAPVFWLWNPLSLALVMTGYAVVANVPFIVVQRFNRARLLEVLRSQPPRPQRPPAAQPEVAFVTEQPRPGSRTPRCSRRPASLPALAPVRTGR